jgi:hypothetical protein
MEEAVETWPKKHQRLDFCGGKYRKVLEHNGKDANI